MSKGMVALIVVGVIIGGLAIAAIGGYAYVNGLRTTRVNYETQLSAQYQSNQNYLSEYISGFHESIGVAKFKTEKMEKILTEAVKGRYGEDGFSADGAFFAAVSEAYPDLAGLDIFDQIVDYVKAKREGYRMIQDKLLDMLRSYDNWRKDGIIQSKIIAGILGVPTNDLEARIGANKITGQAALDKMYQIVLTQGAIDAYENGTMEPLQVK